MSQITIQIKNIAQIRAAFSKAPTIMGAEFKKALMKSVVLVQRESMKITPVLTGRLRASHMFELSGAGLKMEASVGPTVNYATFVHDGTRFIKGRPFLKDGAEASLDQIDDFFTDATQQALDKIGRMV